MTIVQTPPREAPATRLAARPANVVIATIAVRPSESSAS